MEIQCQLVFLFQGLFFSFPFHTNRQLCGVLKAELILEIGLILFMTSRDIPSCLCADGHNIMADLQHHLKTYKGIFEWRYRNYGANILRLRNSF